MTEKTLREKLLSSAKLLRALENRTLTNAEVAAMLGVHERYLSAVFNSISRRERGKVALQREEDHKLAEARRQLRIREARKVLNQKKSLEKAAEAAHCSTRTMRRYVDKIAPKEAEEAYE